MTQPNSSRHVWYYLRSGVFQEETEGPFDERAIVELAEAGKIKPRTKLRSPTRTKNSLVYAEDVPALVAAIERAQVAAAASKEEKKRQAADARLEASKKRVESEQEQAASAPAPQTRAQLLHPQRVLLLAASLVALGGVVLPWVHIPMAGGISGIAGGAGDGWFVVACFLLPLGISVAPNLSMSIGLVRRIVAAVFAILGGLVAGLKIWHLHDIFMVSDTDDQFGMGQALAAATVWGPGLFIIIAMAVACVAISFAFRLPPKKTPNPS